MAKRYVLTTEIARVKAKHKPFELQLPDVPYEGDRAEGEDHIRFHKTEVEIPPFQLLSDDTINLLNTQTVAGAREVLGSHYDHFLAAGGSAQILVDIMQEHQRTSLGESSPSAAS